MPFMNESERKAVRDSLGIYEVLLAAHERRQEVFEVVCTSVNQAEAEGRLRTLLGVPEGFPGALPIVDMTMAKWTEESRDSITRQVEHLRSLVSGSQ